MLPRVGSRSPVSSRKSVVFPVPFRPTMPQRSPGATVKVTSENSLVAPKSTPTPAKAICVMWRQLNYRLHSTRALLHVGTRRTAPRIMATAVRAPGRQDAIQSGRGVDGAIFRDAGRTRGRAGARLVPSHVARPPPSEESSRVGACDGARQPCRDGEWT